MKDVNKTELFSKLRNNSIVVLIGLYLKIETHVFINFDKTFIDNIGIVSRTYHNLL